MRLLLTRPLDESEALAEDLRALSHSCLIEPMLTVTPVAGAMPDLAGVQAVLLTSANGARALAPHPVARDLPILTVGASTAEAARAAGFDNVESAGGDVVMLADLVRRRLRPQDGMLLHVAGTAVAGDLAGDLNRDGFVLRRSVLYRADTASALSPACVDALKAGTLDGALFFSPRSAATFVDLVRTAGLDTYLSGLAMYALSPAVARAAATCRWGATFVAERPEKSALLALLRG